jgi:predicted DNA-binding transcriptional regulator YafY
LLKIASVGAGTAETSCARTGEPHAARRGTWVADALDMPLRAQILNGRKIALHISDEQGRESHRKVWPITIGYLDTTRMLIALVRICAATFAIFRTDRIVAMEFP